MLCFGVDFCYLLLCYFCYYLFVRHVCELPCCASFCVCQLVMLHHMPALQPALSICWCVWFFFLCSLNSVCFLLTLIDFQFLTLASVTTCFPSWINHQPELYLPMASLPASKCFLAHLWQWTWHKGRSPTFLSLGYCCISGFNKDHKSTGKINE